MSKTIITRSARETQRSAALLAKEIAAKPADKARVIALNGNLGAGKTTFTQGFARALGIIDRIQSPTFVLMKIYSLKRKKNLKHLIHIDAYRIEKLREIEHLGLRELFNDKDAVILIEWANRIKKVLPKDTVWIDFKHGATVNLRTITMR